MSDLRPELRSVVPKAHGFNHWVVLEPLAFVFSRKYENDSLVVLLCVSVGLKAPRVFLSSCALTIGGGGAVPE